MLISLYVRAGLSSTDAVQLSVALEQALGRELPPTLAFNYPTVASMAAFLAAEGAVATLQPAADPDTELSSCAAPRPQRVSASLQPGLQLDATASLQIAIVATHLQLPGEGIAIGEPASGSDRCGNPSCKAVHTGSARVCDKQWRSTLGAMQCTAGLI